MKKTLEQIRNAETWAETERLSDALAVMADEIGRVDVRDCSLAIANASRIARCAKGMRETRRATSIYNRALGDLCAALMD